MLFNNKCIYYIHISEPKFSNISIKNLELIFLDGRYISPFIEKLVDGNFSNLNKTKTDAKGMDFICSDENIKPLEQRGFPQNKKYINLIPSNMIGVGRKYNEAEYIKNLNAISGYVIAYQLTWLGLIIFLYILLLIM